ncbi:MAG: hypothetical protein V4714_16840 [Bacteroidota bacterium]
MQIVFDIGFYLDKAPNAAYKSIGITSEKINECRVKYQMEDFNGIFGNPSFGFKEDTFDFVNGFVNVKMVHFWDIAVSNLSGLYQSPEIEYLSVMGSKPGIDFSHFPNLKTVIVDWNKGDIHLNTCEKVERFHLWHYKPKERSFQAFDFPKFARSVQFNWTNAEDLTTVSGLKGMVDLEIHQSRNLKSLKGLEQYADTLERIWVDSCGKLSDYSFILDFPKLNMALINRVKIK